MFTNIKCRELILTNDTENWYIILHDQFSRLWYIVTPGLFSKDASHIGSTRSIIKLIRDPAGSSCGVFSQSFSVLVNCNYAKFL